MAEAVDTNTTHQVRYPILVEQNSSREHEPGTVYTARDTDCKHCVPVETILSQQGQEVKVSKEIQERIVLIDGVKYVVLSPRDYQYMQDKIKAFEQKTDISDIKDKTINDIKLHLEFVEKDRDRGIECYNVIETKLKKMELELNQAKDELNDTNHIIKKKDEERHHLRSKIKQQLEATAKLQESYHAKSKEAEDSKRHLDHMTQKLNEFLDENDKLRRSLDRYENELQISKNTLLRTENVIGKLKEEYEQKVESSAVKDNTIENLELQCTQLQKEIQSKSQADSGTDALGDASTVGPSRLPHDTAVLAGAITRAPDGPAESIIGGTAAGVALRPAAGVTLRPMGAVIGVAGQVAAIASLGPAGAIIGGIIGAIQGTSSIGAIQATAVISS
ncbi:unnamed protein product [Owenia fusiformis]|uniref:Uncharacterized protein n=1 Tax=Owenia fusiformis TaxID=6347 RepID=A0A8J1UH08_OWEFU|nr:unnamed protein product [Owenia fusiformis]